MSKSHIDWDRFASIRSLDKGKHGRFEEGACALEAVSYIAGEPWSDHPTCVSPVIADFMRLWNDYLPDEDRTCVLLPLIPRVVGTAANPHVERVRAHHVVGWFVNTYAPTWLRSVELPDLAASLSRMPMPLDMPISEVLEAVLTLDEVREGLADGEFFDPLLLVRFFFQESLVNACNDAVAACISGEALEAWETLVSRIHGLMMDAVWKNVSERAGPSADAEDAYVDALDATAAVVEAQLRVEAIKLIEDLAALDGSGIGPRPSLHTIPPKADEGRDLLRKHAVVAS